MVQSIKGTPTRRANRTNNKEQKRIGVDPFQHHGSALLQAYKQHTNQPFQTTRMCNRVFLSTLLWCLFYKIFSVLDQVNGFKLNPKSL